MTSMHRDRLTRSILVGPTSRSGILVPPERAGYDGDMATDALVDVSYRGFMLGKRLRLLQVGPRSAYVACDAPMPVGTELILAVDETLTIPAQVARVHEADSKDGPTGMWLWTDAAEARAQAWWSAHVSAADPHIPEPAGGRIRTEGPLAPPPAEVVEASAEAGVSEAVETLAESALSAATEPPPESPSSSEPDTAAVPGDAAEQPHEATGGADARDDAGYSVESAGDDLASDAGEEISDGAGRARRARGTEVMTAVELAEVLGTDPEAAAADDSAAEDGEPPGRPREVRRTQVMSAVEVDELLQAGSTDEPSRPEATAKGKSRNKRRRRR